MIAGLKASESDSEILYLDYGNSNFFFILLPGISISSISLLCTILKTSFINVSLLCHLSFFLLLFFCSLRLVQTLCETYVNSHLSYEHSRFLKNTFFFLK